MSRRSGLKVIALIGAALALSGQAEPPGAAFQRIVGEARAARERQDYPAYLARVRALAALLPGHSAMHYSHARGLALTGDRAAAIATLGRLADAGYGYDAGADPSFASLQGDPGFAAVNARLSANREPRGPVGSQLALGLDRQQPEGVAALGDNSFLIGTLRGAIYRLAGQVVQPLATVGAAVVGIRPDPVTGTFLACVSDEAARRSMVQRRRLSDGALVAMYPLPAAGTFCNDIALVPGGFVATDSDTGTLYRLDDGRLVPLPGAPAIFANGIAFDPAGNRLYVASGNGIVAIDPATDEARPLALPHMLGGIDGMVWHDGALIAVQSVTVPARVLRVTPTAGGDARVEVLLSGEPLLAGATTVAVDEYGAAVLTQTGIPNGSQPDAPILVRVPVSR